MKIISKYKDFYDYLAQDYDADIYYIRNPKYKIMTPDLRKLYVRSWYEKTENSLLGTNLDYREIHGLELGDVKVNGIIFGVYPFVYSTPVFILYGRSQDDCVCWGDTLVVFPGRSFIDNLKDLKDGKQLRETISKFCKESVVAYNKSIEKDYRWVFGMADVEYKVDKNFDYSDISTYIGKVECREIFEALGSPVFIENTEYILDDINNNINIEGDRKGSNYIIDISFNKINPNIIKYWYNDLYNLNTYNYIENFLWSQKHEIASEQTNSEKILSHGFDLKTSFRKM